MWSGNPDEARSGAKLRGEIIHPLNQVKAHPLTQTYIPLFARLAAPVLGR